MTNRRFGSQRFSVPISHLYLLFRFLIVKVLEGAFNMEKASGLDTETSERLVARLIGHTGGKVLFTLVKSICVCVTIPSHPHTAARR